LSDNDRCIRCFEEETITHLLLECPYTIATWQMLGMSPTTLTDILIEADPINIELISHVISELVFRKRIIPPEILIRSIIRSYSKGLCCNSKVTIRATNTVNNALRTGIYNVSR
jgi:hypothetical protein